MKITDKMRIAYMLKVEAIGGEWFDPKKCKSGPTPGARK